MEKRKVKKIKAEDIDSAIFNLHEYGINPYTREIFLGSFYGDGTGEVEESGMDYRMALVFIKNLAFLNNQSKERILIHQNSCGGDWNYGMAIYDAVLTSVAPVTILAYAHARSMSSITLQAAGTRILMPDCDFLIHHGDLGFCDRAIPVLSNVEWWKNKEMPRMMDIYAQRCKGSKVFLNEPKKGIISFLLQKMQEKTDWILTAEEAVRHGFADGILGQKKFKTIEGLLK